MAVTLKNSALKELLKSRGVKNYSSANKDQLLKMVEASGGLPHDAPAPAAEPAPAEPVAAEPKSPKKKVKKVKVVEEPAEVEEPVKKVKKVKKDKSPSPEKKPTAKKAKKSVDLRVDVSQ